MEGPTDGAIGAVEAEDIPSSVTTITRSPARAGVAHTPLGAVERAGMLHTIGSSGFDGSSFMICPTSFDRALSRSNSDATYSIPSSSITTDAVRGIGPVP